MGLLLYNLCLRLYTLGLRLVSPWNPKARSWVNGRSRLFDKIASSIAGNTNGIIWMHCASRGEFEQGRPVMESLKAIYPGRKLMVTFFSPSAYNMYKNFPGVDYLFYLPMDSKQNANRFIDLVCPSLVLWIKHDYWYHFLRSLYGRQIPTLLVSANFRAEQIFFKSFGGLARRMLGYFSHLFVQSADSLVPLKTWKLDPKASVIGDTRFDQVISTAENFIPIPLIASFCGEHRVIVAGSTWEEDLQELDHYANTHPEIRFIVAPHEVDEDQLKEAEHLFHRCVRYSRLVDYQADSLRGQGANVLIIDNLGMLSRLYHYATIAYVGGGFVSRGVHNLAEAAVYGKPVVCGPVIEEATEAIELVECGGALVIDSAVEAEAVFERLLSNKEEYTLCGEAAQKLIYRRRGATRKITDFIQENRLLTN